MRTDFQHLISVTLGASKHCLEFVRWKIIPFVKFLFNPYRKLVENETASGLFVFDRSQKYPTALRRN